MKSSLWILNSALAVLLLATLIFVIFSIKNLIRSPNIVSIKPAAGHGIAARESLKPQDLKIIYETNDLFGTYSPIVPQEVPAQVPVLPQPPMPRPLVSTPVPEIQLLEPLPLKISGIISHSVEAKSQVTFVNTNTKQSQSFKVGEKIFDAHVIRIFPRKVILLRSNGQQETIYMYQEDAQREIKNLKEPNWSDVVTKLNENTYQINFANFSSQITLAKLIDMLDAQTAYSKGTKVGCWIGKMEPNSIGYSLGLLPGDVITSINNIPPTTTENRIEIYNSVQQKEQNKITIEILRNGRYITHEYIINYDHQHELKNKPSPEEKVNPIEITKTDLSIKDQKNKLSDPIQKLKRKDRQSMLDFGSKKSVIKSEID